MNIPKSSRLIIMEMLAVTMDDHFVDGVMADKDAWYAAAEQRLRDRQPLMARKVTSDAVRAVFKSQGNEMIRKSRATMSVTGQAKRKAKKVRTRDIVQIRQPDGTYVAKRFSECSQVDVAQLIDQYSATARGARQHIQFLKNVHRQMRLTSRENVLVRDVTSVQEPPAERVSEAA